MIKKEIESQFTTFDGASIFYRQWCGESWNNKVVILLHRGHEHSKRLEEIAQNKQLEGYKVYAYDYRGHGYSKAEKTDEFMNLVRDLQAFVSFVCAENNISERQVFIIANSVAGVVAATWIHDYAPNIAGVALVAPAFRIKLYFPWAKELLTLVLKVKPKLNIKSYVKAKFLTRDIGEQQKYNADTLITPDIPAKQLVSLLNTAERVVADANLISVPTLLISAQKDYVVDAKIQGDFYAKLSSKHKKILVLPNSYHAVLYDLDKDTALTEIFSFMNECFVLKKEDYLSQKVMITENETAKIRYGSTTPINALSFFIQRQLMQRLGFLSEGMTIGLKYGFDSGVTLDHVYKNEAQGKTIIGKWIDRGYLDSIGWQGIRQRKIHMEQSLRQAIEDLLKQGKSIHILDIAGGPARYLIDIAKDYPQARIVVHDYQTQNIEQGKTLATENNLANISYCQADAFSAATYQQLDFKPTIVVVSGIFELFPDNGLVNQAIAGITSVLDEKGYVLYTGQPWHPQLEQIAKVLGNHRQENWVMRRRSQYELDALFAKANLIKQTMLIDNWGIFTVSSARLNATHDD